MDSQLQERSSILWYSLITPHYSSPTHHLFTLCVILIFQCTNKAVPFTFKKCAKAPITTYFLFFYFFSNYPFNSRGCAWQFEFRKFEVLISNYGKAKSSKPSFWGKKIKSLAIINHFTDLYAIENLISYFVIMKKEKSLLINNLNKIPL